MPIAAQSGPVQCGIALQQPAVPAAAVCEVSCALQQPVAPAAAACTFFAVLGPAAPLSKHWAAFLSHLHARLCDMHKGEHNDIYLVVKFLHDEQLPCC